MQLMYLLIYQPNGLRSRLINGLWIFTGFHYVARPLYFLYSSSETHSRYLIGLATLKKCVKKSRYFWPLFLWLKNFMTSDPMRLAFPAREIRQKRVQLAELVLGLSFRWPAKPRRPLSRVSSGSETAPGLSARAVSLHTDKVCCSK